MDGVYSVQKPEGIRFCKTRVTESCETSCGGWNSNPGPLEEKSVFLTSETSL